MGDKCMLLRLEGEGRSYQLIEDTLVQGHFGPAALELIVVVVLKAVGMGLEFLQAMGVDVLDTVPDQHTHTHAPFLYRTTLARQTYTLAAQRVTFRPSFKQSNSPRPLASSLHFMKSSL